MSIGSTYAALGRHQEAMFHLQRAIAIAPNYALAHFNLGHVFDALGQFTKAIEFKSEAARLDPSFPEAFCSRGITLYKMGCREEAQADWKRAIALNPKSRGRPYESGNQRTSSRESGGGLFAI